MQQTLYKQSDKQWMHGSEHTNRDNRMHDTDKNNWILNVCTRVYTHNNRTHKRVHTHTIATPLWLAIFYSTKRHWQPSTYFLRNHINEWGNAQNVRPTFDILCIHEFHVLMENVLSLRRLLNNTKFSQTGSWNLPIHPRLQPRASMLAIYWWQGPTGNENQPEQCRTQASTKHP